MVRFGHMVTPEATTLAVYNIGGGKGFTGDAERIAGIYDWLKLATPDVAVMPEAYRPEVPGSEHRMESVAEDLAKLGPGYHVGYTVYTEEGAPEPVGMVMLARRGGALSQETAADGERVQGDADFFRLVRLAGRGAIEMSIVDMATGRDVPLTGAHFNTFGDARYRELLAYLARNKMHLLHEEPFGLLADVNSVSYRNLFTLLLLGAGVATQTGVRAGVLPEADIHDKQGLARIVSLVERAAAYATGRESRELDRLGFRNAVPAHKPTASLPEIPGSIARPMRHIPVLGKWILAAPHLGIDQIRLFPATQWDVESAQVYTQSMQDDHTPVAADVKLVQAAV